MNNDSVLEDTQKVKKRRAKAIPFQELLIKKSHKLCDNWQCSRKDWIWKKVLVGRWESESIF